MSDLDCNSNISEMDTSEIRLQAIDALAGLHHLPFHVHYLTIGTARSGKRPQELPEFDTFTLEAKGDDLRIRPKPDKEWRDALLEASREKMGPGELPLTPNAKALLDWLRRPGNSPASIKVNTLGKKAGFKGPGSYHRWEDYCREIGLKTDYHIQTGRERGSWGDAVIELTLHEKSEEDKPEEIDAENPHFAFNPTKISKEACDAFARLIEDVVMKSGDPRPGLDLIVYALSTHSALEKAWPATLNDREVGAYELARFLEKIRIAPCLMLVWSIPRHGDCWLVGCRPVDGLNWDTVRKKITGWRSFRGSRETFGLSESSALVLDWLLSLRPDQFTLRLSPQVSTAWEDEIGFKPEYHGTLRWMKLEAIADEINERTPYEVRVFSSKEASYHQSDCRLLFKCKPTGEELLLRQIQHFLLDNATIASESDIREWLTDLIRNNS